MSRDRIFKNSVRRRVVRMAERFEGSNVVANLDLLSETQWFDREQIEHFWWPKLLRLLDHAYKHVPYYKSVFDSLSMTPGDIRTMDDFRRIPIISKKDIRDNLKTMQATGADTPMQVIQAQTGGTTGEPLKFLRDARCNAFTRAALLRSYAWSGYRIGDPMLFLTGGSLLASPQTLKQKIGFCLMNYYFMPGFKLQASTLQEYVTFMRAKKIRFVRGYATLLHQLAELCHVAGVKDIRLTAVFPTAEMLTKTQIEQIKDTFQCGVFDQYGCAETNTLANECSHGRFHINEEHALIEEVEDHALIVTDLDNYAQPFIRYAISDRGKIVAGRCPCGRNLLWLEEFLGRISDAIVLNTGERYPGVFFHHLFGHFPGVTQFQVIQERRGELVIKIIRNANFQTGDEASIKKLVEEHTSIAPRLEYCENIPRVEGDKITSVICTIDAL